MKNDRKLTLQVKTKKCQLENFANSDFVTKTTGYGDNFEVYKAAGKVAEGFWIGIKSINGNDDSKRQMYWSDKPGVYLKSGDYGYDRYKLPWAHGPDRNPEWTKVFHIMNIIF